MKEFERNFIFTIIVYHDEDAGFFYYQLPGHAPSEQGFGTLDAAFKGAADDLSKQGFALSGPIPI